MMFDTLIKTSRLRYKMPRMRYRIQSALDIISAAYDKCDHPIVAYSSGKDSQVMLDLVYKQHSEAPVWFSDHRWLLPGTVQNLVATENHYDVHITRYRISIEGSVKHKRGGVQEFIDMWGELRPPPSMQEVDYTIDDRLELLRQLGIDGTFLGLRREESSQRHFVLNVDMRRIKSTELWHIYPLRDWTWEDIWAYIAGENLPYHPNYPLQINAGIHPRYARVGSMIAAVVELQEYALHEKIKLLHPEYWSQFVAYHPSLKAL